MFIQQINKILAGEYIPAETGVSRNRSIRFVCVQMCGGASIEYGV